MHRALLRSGWYERRLPAEVRIPGRVFGPEPPEPDPDEAQPPDRAELLAEAEAVLAGRIRLFDRGPFDVGSPPAWFVNPITGARVTRPALHWSAIGDFDSGAGDIKGVWELSRFGWAVTLARACRCTGDARYLEALDEWVRDWVVRNPLHQGPNWKCGQETSLRMLHLLSAARALGHHRAPTGELARIVVEHLRRVEATLSYALAQDNNHGTSEAAALYVGGAWLASIAAEVGPDAGSILGPAARRAGRWERLGRNTLIERVLRLVEPDGSFSQYSVNYHRMVVDTLSLVESWRRELGRPGFPEPWVDRCRRAVEWLSAFTDPVTGGAPNVGANDGALVFVEEVAPARDFRPSVRRGRSLFELPRAASIPSPAGGIPGDGTDSGSRLFACGGYVRLAPPTSRDAGAGPPWAMIRFPRYRFRPSDSDPLHLDLWHRGVNLLRDGGSYSYNADDPELRDILSGPAGHNTIEFDGRDPMPRLGRFLRGHWLRAADVTPIAIAGDRVTWSGAYRDHLGAEHRRTVSAGADGVWEVVDQIRGYVRGATLRWRLTPDEWELTASSCESPAARITLEASVPLLRIALVTGRESLHYGEHTPIPVLEADLPPPSYDGRIEIRTRIELR